MGELVYCIGQYCIGGNILWYDDFGDLCWCVGWWLIQV